MSLQTSSCFIFNPSLRDRWLNSHHHHLHIHPPSLSLQQCVSLLLSCMCVSVLPRCWLVLHLGLLCHSCGAMKELFASLHLNPAAFLSLSVMRELFELALDLIWASLVQPVVVIPQFLTFLLPLWIGTNTTPPSTLHPRPARPTATLQNHNY